MSIKSDAYPKGTCLELEDDLATERIERYKVYVVKPNQPRRSIALFRYKRDAALFMEAFNERYLSQYTKKTKSVTHAES